MVKSGLASPLFLCKYPQENITIQRVVAKQADTLQQTARIRLAAGKGRSMRRRQEAGICVSTLTKRAVSQ